MKTFNENQAIYIINNKKYYVYACWDSETEKLKDSTVDFYDVEDSEGDCLNLGAPFFHFPSRSDVAGLIK